jgi:acetylornithine deacetylase/succinyl-diaminopimelate desuccinylase-like protein
MDRREFVITSAMAAASAALPKLSFAADDELQPIYNEITKRHDEAVQRLQTWIRQPSIAAEHRGIDEGCQLLMDMLKDAGFQNVQKVPTDGNPGIFAVMDNGAPKTIGLYFMYDVKQADPSEWSSPPFEARLVDKPGFGKVIVGRGATNQKGPEATFLAALHAIHGAGRKVPVNFVFVAEGEEEIASPHFPQVVHRPDVLTAMRKCEGVYMPMASQDADGDVTIDLGAKGVIELELVSSGEKWGRGPMQDLHSSNKARVDSPAWHLVKALSTLVSQDGNTPFTGFAANARPLSAEDRALIADAAKRLNEATLKKAMGVQHWIHDVDFQKSLEMLAADPTINIEGLVGGYTGPGGERPSCRTARWRRSIAAWCPT